MDNALKLDNQLCFRTYTASRLIIRLYKPLLDALNLTYPQYVTMLVLWEDEEVGFRELGKRLQMKTGTLTPIIQRLIKLDYVSKIKDPNDDRRVVVLLTELGKSLIPEAEKVPYKLAEKLNLTKDQFLNYIKTLDEFIEKLHTVDLEN